MDKTHTNAILATALILSLAAAPVAAAESSVLEDVRESEAASTIETVSRYADFAASYARGAYERVSGDLFGEASSWSAESNAAAIRSEVENHSVLYAEWLSERLEAREDRDVLRVTVENETSEAVVYVEADVENGTYRNVTAVRSTSRTVDESCTLSEDAGRNAPEELEAFREDVVVPDEDLSAGLTGRFAGQYSGQIDCTFT